MVVWLAVVFVLLMGTVNKQMQYALLFAPPLAVLLGYYVCTLQFGQLWRQAGMFLLWCAVLLLTFVAFIRQPAEGIFNMTWPIIVLMPLLLRRVLREEATAAAMLLVSGLMVALFLYLEIYDKDTRKTQLIELMETAKQHQELYQLKPGDGAVSFYAGRVVQPLAEGDILDVADRVGTLWVITSKGESLRLGEKVMTSGEVALWRVSPEP